MNELRNAFPGQNKTEPVFIFLRRHFIAFAPFFLIISIMFALGSFMVGYTIFVLRYQPGLDPIIYNWSVAASGIFLLFCIGFSTVAWLDFYFDIHIVTDRRVVDVNQNRLFNRNVSELSLEDIEDVSVNLVGVFQTFFNYGNIEIQTAGTRANFNFQDIANPREVASVVSDLADQAKKGIAENFRFPHSHIKGVINNNVITSREGLISQGALRPDEKMNLEENA